MNSCLPPCVHRGELLRHAPCGCGRRGELEPVYACALHGPCVERKSAAGDGLRVCLTCRDRCPRRLIVVCGPESSGNRLAARLLIAAGAVGSGTMDQTYDRQPFPADAPVVVWVQSFPHGGGLERHWPDPELWRRRAEADRRTLVVVRTRRDPHAVVASQVAAGHVATPAEAAANLAETDRRLAPIFCSYEVRYEELVTRPAEIGRELIASVGLPPLQQLPEAIENRNIKWGIAPVPHHKDLTPESPLDFCRQLLDQPPGPWPAGWAGFPNVQAAFRAMFADAARRAREQRPPESWAAPAGIVICAGGWRFFPSLYVTVRMIRHVGCTLPIQVWYLGDRREFDERMQQALEPYDVGWIDGNAYAREHGTPRRILGGWELKPFAALYAPYHTVLSLDADSYPAYNPEEFLAHPEFARVGAAFWPDQPKLKPEQWDLFGVSRHDEAAWESGQFIVDKARHWSALWLADWLNDHSDYVYQHIYGDKDTFHLAWRKLGAEVCVPTREPGWDRVAFLQRDFAGRTLFVHRTRDKFRWKGGIDGHGIPAHYMTTQWHSETQHIPTLPHEDAAHGFCRESSEMLRPELHLALRPDTWDAEILRSVWLRNEYRLPPRFAPDDVIVDIGAHVGGFALACLSRGAGRVICVEPHPDSARLLRQNLARYGDRVTIIEAAAWHEHATLQLTPAIDHLRNTGGASVMREANGHIVQGLPLDEIVGLAGQSVRLLKVDCEGAEYALLAADSLSTICECCGEAHALTWCGRNWDVNDVVQLLVGRRFESWQNGPRAWLWNAGPLPSLVKDEHAQQRKGCGNQESTCQENPDNQG